MFDSSRHCSTMIYKVIIVVSVIKLCVGDMHVLPALPSHQAVSSHSFVRQDVPISYKYSAVHVYTTVKPDHSRHKPITPSHHRTEIQYAPIGIANNPTKIYDDRPATDNKKQLKKQYLQPNPHERHNDINRPNQLTFVPGYNIEILQSVDRYPGRNAVYRSYPNMPPNEKLSKVNHLNQYLFYQKLKQKQEAATKLYPKNFVIYKSRLAQEDISSKSKPEVTTSIIGATKSNEENPNVYVDIARNGLITEFHAMNALSELPPHPKTHRMLLNIARAYKIANNPRMALTNKSVNPLQNETSNTHLILHLPNGNEQKTKLYSIQNRYQYPGYIHL